MKVQKKAIDSDSQGTLLIEMEKSVLEAFKNKRDDAFRKNFAGEYMGIANDGIKNADAEVAGMHKLDLREVHLENEKVMFPVKDVAILTYKMVVEGSLNGQDISGSVYSSSVYVNREDKWLAVLHTESKAIDAN
jgi:hypothetical protein